MKRVFLTFGDGGSNFTAARERIIREAERTGQFDEVLGYDWNNVSPEMQKSPLRNSARGCGYWAWKSDIIHSVLSRLDNGDILVYCDAGCVLHNISRQWHRLFERLKSADMIVRKIRYCAYQWTRRELLQLFTPIDIPGKTHMCFQFEASVLVLKKTAMTMQIVNDWRTITLMYPEAVVDIEDNRLKSELPSFASNRHDQSLLTLLIYRSLAKPEFAAKINIVWDFHFGLNIFCNPAIEVARQRSGSEVQPNHIFSAKIFRALYRICCSAQTWLESKGVLLCWTNCR